MSGPFLRNPYLLALTVVVVLVAGLSAVVSLPRVEDPRIVNRFPLVVAAFPGASAERVEALIVEPIENALDEIELIKTVESTARAGSATLSVELVDSIDASNSDNAYNRVRTKVREAATLLPPEAPEPRVDDQLKPVAFTRTEALLWTGEGEAPMGVLQRLAEDLADALRTVPGTELVRLYGGAEEEITVLLDPTELETLGLGVRELSRRVAAADARRPAGALRTGESTLLLEVDGALDSLERVRAIPLGTSPDGALLRLGDIATVERSVRDPARQIGLIDGKRAILIAARTEQAVQIGDWAAASREVVEAFDDRIGGTIERFTVFDQSEYTNARLSELVGNLLLGALVIMVVVLLTMGWRQSLLVGLALPLTVAATMFGIFVLGGEIHQMSIFGMIIALGLLIDNAIVVVDEVRKRREDGLSAVEAVTDASRHLVGPLFASTLTTVLAFAPIVLLPGAAGDFVGYIGVSVILAISSSFLLSMTVIAALAGHFGRFRKDDNDRRAWWRYGIPGGRLAALFAGLLRSGLDRPWLPMAVAALLPILGFVAATQLGRSFFPPTDRNMFDVQVWMPSESSVESTLEATRAIEERIRRDEAVRHVHWMVGGSFPSVYYNLIMNKVDNPDYARGVVVVDSAADTARLVPRLQAEVDRSLTGAQVVFRAFGQGPPVEADVQFRLFGPSIETLQTLGEEVRLALQSHPGVLHTQVSMPRGEPKLWLEADETEAARAGLSLTEIAAQLEAGLEGTAGGVVLEDLEQLPVRLRLADTRSDLASLESMRLASAGDSLPLEAIGRLDLRPELGGVSRYDGERCNTVLGFTADGELPIEVSRSVLARLDEVGFALPPGYRIEQGGAAEADQEAVGNLLTYAPILVTIMLAAVILVFRSVRIALLLIVVAVLSVGLATLATWTWGFPISFNTILGTLGLIGVALNDSIVVLAAIRGNPQARIGDLDAIAEEVMGCTRHVVSTTLTTMGGFLPLLLFIGGEFWPSLAIVLAGGVGGATILAVLFVPGAYVLMHRFHRRSELGGRPADAAPSYLGSAGAPA